MIKVETLVHEYEHCIDCPHCNLDHYEDYRWACDFEDKTITGIVLKEWRIPKWCPLPTKELKGANP